jgi:hypothetical protein
MDEDLPEEIKSLVASAINPEGHFRRMAAKSIVREFHKRFGDMALLDILVAVDGMDKYASAIVMERSEIDNYVFQHYGVYDDDMFTKAQMTDAWNDFMDETVHRSGLAAAKAVEEVLNLEDAPPE